jgi:hypothetical protein
MWSKGHGLCGLRRDMQGGGTLRVRIVGGDGCRFVYEAVSEGGCL